MKGWSIQQADTEQADLKLERAALKAATPASQGRRLGPALPRQMPGT